MLLTKNPKLVKVVEGNDYTIKKPTQKDEIEKDSSMKKQIVTAQNGETITNYYGKGTGTVADVLKQQMKGIDNNFAKQIPQYDESQYASQIQYQDDFMPNDAQIQQEADKNLSNYKEDNLQKIEQDYQQILSSQNLNELTSKQDLAYNINEVEQQRINKSNQVLAKTISQGIENSSIAHNLQKDIQAKFSIEMGDVMQKYQNSIAQIELKKTMAQAEMENALEKFDISYATKLQKEIADLTSEYNKTKSKADDYNQKIDDRRKQLYQKWQKENQAEIDKIENDSRREQAFYLINQLSTYPKQEALKIMEDAEMAEMLGSRWYNTVITYLREYF